MTVSLLSEFVDWNSRCSNSNETTLVGFCTVICILKILKNKFDIYCEFLHQLATVKKKRTNALLTYTSQPMNSHQLNHFAKFFFQRSDGENYRGNKLEPLDGYRGTRFSQFYELREREPGFGGKTWQPSSFYYHWNFRRKKKLKETIYQMLSFIILRSWEG